MLGESSLVLLVFYLLWYMYIHLAFCIWVYTCILYASIIFL